jgi:hypothetical protein
MTEESLEDLFEDGDSRPELPPADFDFLIYSLPMDDKEPDFELARHHIDLLAMLQEKTKGNLTLAEQTELDNSVTELRFRFVQLQEKTGA